MSQKNTPQIPGKIFTEAVVRSASGSSLLETAHPITTENVLQFHAPSDRLKAAAYRLQEAGFEVLNVGDLSITIAAAPEVYERSFQSPLEAVERPVIKEFGQPSTATFINALDGKPFGEIDTSQTAWNDLLDGIAINEPVYYFQFQHPMATPPQTAKPYLSVPEGVAQGLNAAAPHQRGITGKGVHVVMVDSGWYPHPFFAQHQYRAKVVLAPGSTGEFQDEIGHGTGESANVFAIAPDATLTMVKADVALTNEVKNVNSIAALKQAIALQPDVLSCSWGSSLRDLVLSPYHRLLAATVAEAVRRGIIVIFSAGNGSYGFPAQHPEVIAAGGVYLHLAGSLQGTLEASNYASSFVSRAYPGRQVPDVCGLVGQLPYGDYILLPVPPGSGADRSHALGEDGTEPTDGWAAFSGTSAAAPQLAGICALMKQVRPDLSPAEAKRILQQTARDVVEGFSSPSTGRAPARAGPDLATGHGLVDACRAVQMADSTISNRKSNLFNVSEIQITATKRSTQRMYPKLRAKLDEIQLELNKHLREKFIDIDAPLIEDVELLIDESNFIDPSPQTKAISSLLKLLMDLPRSEDERLNAIEKKHVLAAESLIKIRRAQELAMEVLVLAISSVREEVPELAAKALGEMEVFQDSINYYDDRCNNGCCPVGPNGSVEYYTKGGKNYSDPKCEIPLPG